MVRDVLHRFPRGGFAQALRSLAEWFGMNTYGPTAVRPSTAYVPEPKDRVTVALSSFGANLPGVIIGACRPGWSTVRITEAAPGKPWPVVDIPNRRLRKVST